MTSRFSRLLALTVLWLGIVACSGDGSPRKIVAQDCQTPTGQGLCLVRCTLGCDLQTCSLTDIAQNQQITFVFSQALDPRSVNSSTVSFRTAAGEEPVGQLVVAEETITFIPEVRIIGSRSFFGFRSNETYLLSMPSGSAPEALTSTSGDRLLEPLNCSLRVSRGVIDVDGRPPQVEMRSPAELTNVDPQTPIILEWSELIEAAPFLGNDPPVNISVRTTRDNNGSPECDPTAKAIVLSGSWRVENDPFTGRTRATFATGQSLPGDVCVQIEVTDRIRDLAGNAGNNQFFQYLIQPQQRSPIAIEEPFDNDLQLDPAGSSGSWTNGVATPGQIGGSGRLGAFNIENGVAQGSSTFVWNVDNMTIPRTQTLSGEDITVTDGVFEFERFILPPNRTLKFIGTRPPRIYSRGIIDIQGTIDVSATDVGSTGNGPTGQQTEAPGPFGGRGGNGANRCLGNGPGAQFNGSAGANVMLPVGHAYAARAANTGGRGSLLYPAAGTNASVTFVGFFCLQATSAAGGGGHAAAGGIGKVTSTNPVGPDTAGGVLFNNLPVPNGANPLDHLLVGGSGGGGGGSHPMRSISPNAQWKSGGAGGSGGGAILLRAGGDLRLSGAGSIRARGASTATNAVGAAIGGAGSGGTILLQTGGAPVLPGEVDVRGGTGGSLNDVAAKALLEAGDGSPGFLLLEAPTAPAPSVFADAKPPATNANVGQLTGRDNVVGAMSKFYLTNQLFPPTFLRYELTVRTASGTTVYSDDSSKGPLADESAPVTLLVQGGDFDPAKGAVGLDDLGPWRTRVGRFGQPSLADDVRNAVRFAIQFRDRDARVEDLKIYFLPR